MNFFRRRKHQQATPSRTFNTTGTSGDATVNNAGRDIIRGDYIENYISPAPQRISLFPGFVVQDAAYDGRSARVGCLRGTRKPAIEKILRWKDEPEAQPICWMNAPAGFGKSAVSQTIAESCARDGTLAASFFFLRGAGERSGINHFITTLVHQIMISVPEVKPFVEEALQRDPTILYKSITNQLQHLIVTPFMTLAQTDAATPTLLVVVDALDECVDRESMREFITALASAYLGGQLRLRWLLTSRGEEHIRQSFSSDAAETVTSLLRLEEFNADNDIKTFLGARFSEIIKQNRRLFRTIPLPWPSPEDLDALVEKSSGLFIFAATLVNFVTDGKAPPNRKLQSVLKMHAGLDPLYEQVIRDVPEIDCFRRVLTTLMLLHKQPSVELLAQLLGLDAADILHALLTIQSIITIPSDDNAPIQLNHTSLRDFLVDESRSRDLFIDPPAAHATLAATCVKILQKNLKVDIFPRDAGATYTATYWSHHLLDSHKPSEADPELLRVLQNFSSPQVIERWINELIQRTISSNWVTQLTILNTRYERSEPGLARVLEKIKTKLQTDKEDWVDYIERNNNNLEWENDWWENDELNRRRRNLWEWWNRNDELPKEIIKWRALQREAATRESSSPRSIAAERDEDRMHF